MAEALRLIDEKASLSLSQFEGSHLASASSSSGLALIYEEGHNHNVTLRKSANFLSSRDSVQSAREYGLRASSPSSISASTSPSKFLAPNSGFRGQSSPQHNTDKLNLNFVKGVAPSRSQSERSKTLAVSSLSGFGDTGGGAGKAVDFRPRSMSSENRVSMTDPPADEIQNSLASSTISLEIVKIEIGSGSMTESDDAISSTSQESCQLVASPVIHLTTGCDDGDKLSSSVSNPSLSNRNSNTNNVNNNNNCDSSSESSRTSVHRNSDVMNSNNPNPLSITYTKNSTCPGTSIGVPITIPEKGESSLDSNDVKNNFGIDHAVVDDSGDNDEQISSLHNSHCDNNNGISNTSSSSVYNNDKQSNVINSNSSGIDSGSKSSCSTVKLPNKIASENTSEPLMVSFQIGGGGGGGGGGDSLNKGSSGSDSSNRSKSRGSSFNTTDSNTSGVGSCDSSRHLSMHNTNVSLTPIPSSSSLTTVSSSSNLLTGTDQVKQSIHPSVVQRSLFRLSRVPSAKRSSTSPALGGVMLNNSTQSSYTSYRDAVGYAALKSIKRQRSQSAEMDDIMSTSPEMTSVLRSTSNEPDVVMDNSTWLR